MSTDYAFDVYQEEAMSFRLPTATHNYAWNNLVGEVGELFSLVAKAERDGIKDPMEHATKYKKELGDILWSLAAIAQDNGWTLSDVAMTNVAKLQSRADRKKLQGSGDNR